MQYFGGKAKIAKVLSQELQSRLNEGQVFVDLFCGSCNIVSKIKASARIANDYHRALISLHKAVQRGWIPPSSVSEDEYREIKMSKDAPEHLRAFIGFGCSFSGKYFGGYARNKRNDNFCSQSKNSLLKKHKNLSDVLFISDTYSAVHIPEGSLIYCDIPYKSTTGYTTGAFSHEDFYIWASNMQSNGYTVLVSEYLNNVPEGWTIEWTHESKKDIRNKEGIQENTVEILMAPARV